MVSKLNAKGHLVHSRCPFSRGSSAGLLFFQVIQAILSRGNTNKSIESGIERMAGCKTYHITNVRHQQILITHICKNSHSLINTTLIHKLTIVHVETGIHNSRNIARVGSDFLCQFLCWIVLVKLHLLLYNDVHDLFLNNIHRHRTDCMSVFSFLDFQFTNIIFFHIYTVSPVKIGTILWIYQLIFDLWK